MYLVVLLLSEGLGLTLRHEPEQTGRAYRRNLRFSEMVIILSQCDLPHRDCVSSCGSTKKKKKKGKKEEKETHKKRTGVGL